MVVKFLIAVAIVYLGWLAWRGPPGRVRRSAPPSGRAPAVIDPEIAAARSLLGVGADAGDDEIKAAYRRIAAAVHPDRGGSAELARRVNDARDILLKRGPDRAA